MHIQYRYMSVKSFYVDSKAQVRVHRRWDGYFPVKVGLGWECIMSLQLFNIFIHRVVKAINVVVSGKRYKIKIQ